MAKPVPATTTPNRYDENSDSGLMTISKIVIVATKKVGCAAWRGKATTPWFEAGHRGL